MYHMTRSIDVILYSLWQGYHFFSMLLRRRHLRIVWMLTMSSVVFSILLQASNYYTFLFITKRSRGGFKVGSRINERFYLSLLLKMFKMHIWFLQLLDCNQRSLVAQSMRLLHLYLLVKWITYANSLVVCMKMNFWKHRVLHPIVDA